MRECDGCEERVSVKSDTEWLWRDDPLVLLGGAEIWIPDSSQGYFAAPDLIIHYIEEHQYLPPREFLSALAIVDPAELGSGWEVGRYLAYPIQP